MSKSSQRQRKLFSLWHSWGPRSPSSFIYRPVMQRAFTLSCLNTDPTPGPHCSPPVDWFLGVYPAWHPCAPVGGAGILRGTDDLWIWWREPLWRVSPSPWGGTGWTVLLNRRGESHQAKLSTPNGIDTATAFWYPFTPFPIQTEIYWLIQGGSEPWFCWSNR